MNRDREPRESRLLKIRVHCESAGSCEARLHNLSSRGLSITFDEPALVGDHMVFELSGVGRVGGTVCWVRNNRAGVRLDSEIDPGKVVREPPAGIAKVPLYATALLTNAGTSNRPGLRLRRT